VLRKTPKIVLLEYYWERFPVALSISQIHLLVIIQNSVLIKIVPFEEDPKDSSIWFLDHNYLEGMFAMFRKVNGM
jgi:hypothetical protein